MKSSIYIACLFYFVYVQDILKDISYERNTGISGI